MVRSYTPFIRHVFEFFARRRGAAHRERDDVVGQPRCSRLVDDPDVPHVAGRHLDDVHIVRNEARRRNDRAPYAQRFDARGMTQTDAQDRIRARLAAFYV